MHLPEFQHLQERLSACSESDVRRALQSAKPGLEELCALLSPAADPLLPHLAARSRALTLQRFGRTTQLYAPLYLSNFCTNRCVYCGFSAGNSIARRCLSFDEAEAEAEILHRRGFNHILLVSGEAEAIVGVDYLEEVAKRLAPRFASLSIEVQPLSEHGYSRLFRAGITGVAVYQETYDRKLYDELHPAGNKRDFIFRLDTPHRAGRAGMREIGIGALLGLADWRTEGLFLGHHLHALRRAFWRTNFTVSFPRLRPAAGAFAPLTRVSTRDLSHLLFALRIFDADVGLILSTREEQSFRDGMLGLAPTRYSAGSCTAPGGYADPRAQEGEQFSVGDHRSLAEIAAVMRKKGLDPVLKDWDAVFQHVTHP